MTTLLGSVLVASLVGSPHCAGMCGGLVAFCTGVGGGAKSRTALAAYHAARLASYAAVGAVAGALGMALDLGGGAIGLSRTAAIVAGLAICLFGIATLLQLAGARVACLPAPKRLVDLLKKVHGFAMRRGPVLRSTIVGLATPLLPCGWLWAFAAIAAGTASLAWGAVVMIVFWLGTVPILTVVGVGLSWIPAQARRSLAALAAVAMIAVGLHTAVVRSASAEAVAGDLLSRIHRTDRDLAGEAVSIGGDEELPACCRKEAP